MSSELRLQIQSIMKTDKYGQIILTENDLLSLYMKDPEREISRCLVETKIQFSPELELANIPKLIEYHASNLTIEAFDAQQQSNWQMPSAYYKLDIAEWVMGQCKTDAEFERVGTELIMFQDRGLFTLLQYLKYLVDTMRKHNILWGVGRGSSTASYVLYIIGIHRIDSLKYELDISEFLR
jgi:DNA polymerase III alpha subunit